MALLYFMFYYVFVTFLCGALGVLGQVNYLIVSIPDLCLLTYFCISICDPVAGHFMIRRSHEHTMSQWLR